MSLLLVRPLAAAGLAAAVACASFAWAAPSAAAVVPNYEQLIARLDQMPAAVEAAALYEAADARALQARALPNPVLSLDGANLYGSGPYAGYDRAESTLSVNQPLELWGKRSARVDAARAQADATGLRRDQQRWGTAGRLALLYAEAEAAARRDALAAEALALVEQDAQAVDALVEAGREPRLRAIQARSEVQAALAARDEAGALKRGALARLTAVSLWEQPIEAVGDSLLDRLPAASAAMAPMVEPLSVRIAQADVDAANRQVTVERRKTLPDVSLSVGSRRFRETGDTATTVGLQVSIPLFDRNRGGISAAHADVRAAEARLLAQQQQSQADRLGAEAALAASHSRTRAADAGVAASEEAYRLARTGFDAGRISQLELRSARSALIAARSAAVDARMSRVRAEIDLALLQGRVPFGETP